MFRLTSESGVALRAGAGANLLAMPGGWRVITAPGWIELIGEETWPAGWALLRGRLIRRGRDFSARLFAETDDAEYHYDLPVSLKGTLLELIELPQGVRRLRLQPMRSLGEFELHDWRLEPVGWLKRTAYRWRRILPLYFKLSRRQRLILGLRGYTPLIDLERAYRLAGNTRFYAPSPFYDQWFASFVLLNDRERRRIRRKIKRWTKARPQFEIRLHGRANGHPDSLAGTLASLDAQLYRDFSLDESTSTDANTWTLSLQPGMTLSEHALYWLAELIRAHPTARVIYCDHDVHDETGWPQDPVLKPDWSPELLRSTHYIGPTVIFHRETLQRFMHDQGLADAESSAGLHALLLAFCESLQPGQIRHLAAPVWHLPPTRRLDPSPNVVQAHLDRIGVAATASPTERGHYNVRYTLPDPPPRVSILVPTRDTLDYLRPCVESLLSTTTYPDFELLIIDNGSVEPATLAYLKTLLERPPSPTNRTTIRVIRDERPFNFSALNNAAAQQARGEALCLLNNDTEVITPDWLEIMVGHLIQPGVGVVGAKLYYSDERIQHAGDTVGPGGCAHHLHAFLDRDETGYCDRAILAQDLSAVTAACLVTWRRLYLQLGGFDAEHLPVAFNDVDYCLRVREQGQRVVWTPHAELYHHESVSRGKQEDPRKSARAARELAYMRERWGRVMRHDPFYNLNLSYQRPDFSLSHMPMVDRPWL